jgi:ribosomal protein S18 acetylase RimI-like enzyme
MSTTAIVALPRLATPEDARPYLTARPALCMADVLIMGRIRSRQAAGFSTDRAPFDDERQIAWFRVNHDRLLPWLYDDQSGATVGYGCLRQESDGRWYSSVAVLPEHGGHGYGKAITLHLIHTVPHEVWASARADNPAARKLHDPLYWDTIGTDGELIFYRTKPKIRTGGAHG